MNLSADDTFDLLKDFLPDVTAIKLRLNKNLGIRFNLTLYSNTQTKSIKKLPKLKSKLKNNTNKHYRPFHNNSSTLKVRKSINFKKNSINYSKPTNKNKEYVWYKPNRNFYSNISMIKL